MRITINKVVVPSEIPNFNERGASMRLNFLSSYSQLRGVFVNKWLPIKAQGRDKIDNI